MIRSGLRIIFYIGILIIFSQGETLARGGSARPFINAEPDALVFEKLISLHHVKKAPGPYDWLAQHPEPGQTLAEFIASKPVLPNKSRQTIYIMLLGDFDEKARQIVAQTAEFIRVYYGLPVKWASPVALAAIPASAQRVHPTTKDKQILTRYVLEEVLKPAVPRDAFCLIAFTASDLWPGQGWNFVFGEASLDDRVGVWSIYRNGNPNASQEEYKLCLLRTIKTGTHEIGHMFSLLHCIFYECNMNGSNYRKEADARPLYLCPVCLRKLQWGLKFDLKLRFQNLTELCERLGLQEESKFYQDSLKVLGDKAEEMR